MLFLPIDLTILIEKLDKRQHARDTLEESQSFFSLSNLANWLVLRIIWRNSRNFHLLFP